jgi:hypothetical protein
MNTTLRHEVPIQGLTSPRGDVLAAESAVHMLHIQLSDAAPQGYFTLLHGQATSAKYMAEGCL